MYINSIEKMLRISEVSSFRNSFFIVVLKSLKEEIKKCNYMDCYRVVKAPILWGSFLKKSLKGACEREKMLDTKFFTKLNILATKNSFKVRCSGICKGFLASWLNWLNFKLFLSLRGEILSFI